MSKLWFVYDVLFINALQHSISNNMCDINIINNDNTIRIVHAAVLFQYLSVIIVWNMIWLLPSLNKSQFV